MNGLERGIGVVVPSSNRTVERVTETILAHFPGVAACYARIPLWGDGRTGGQRSDAYDIEAVVAAADLLAHARVELLCWNGTKGASLGFDPDRAFLADLHARTGIPGVSTALATLDLLERLGRSRIAIVSPGTEAAMQGISRGFASQGIEVVASRCLDVVDNFACAEIPAATLAMHARELAETTSAEVALIWNTNARGLAAMAEVEAAVDIPIFDSTAIGVWACLDAMQIDTAPAAALGSLFRVPVRSSP
jgi:maleate isomerase